MISYGKQTIAEEDINEVIKALKSEFLTTGPKIKEFEEGFADYVGSQYAVAVSSGTAALHLACLAAGLKEGDELITSPMTFAASANCALFCNARPVFVDVNKQGLIDEDKIEDKIAENTKIIIPVHYTGLPCDMEKIKGLADKYKLIVIEDACHALGSKYKDEKIGNCKYSDMAVFSFHPVKHITTGEGGMITTNSREFYDKLIMLRNHGIVKEPDTLVDESQPWYNEMQELGYNYRITDFQCALGLSQMSRIGEFIKKRREIAARYEEAFKDNKNIEVLEEKRDQFNTYHLFVIKVKNRLELFNYLKDKGIFCQVHYIPVYWHPFYQKLGYKKGICPRAEKFYKNIISIPIYPNLSYEEQELVIQAMEEFFNE